MMSSMKFFRCMSETAHQKSRFEMRRVVVGYHIAFRVLEILQCMHGRKHVGALVGGDAQVWPVSPRPFVDLSLADVEVAQARHVCADPDLDI